MSIDIDFAEVQDFVDGETPVEDSFPRSSAMIERVLHTVLERGFSYYAEHNDVVDRIMPLAEARERARFKKLMVQKPMRVIFGFNRQNESYPICAILLGGEQDAPGETYLGDYGGSGDDDIGDAGGEAVDFSVFGEDGQYVLHLYSEHPDVLIYWYHLTKHILRQCRALLAAAGLDNISLASGDMQPDPRYDPEFIYIRWLRVTGRTRSVVAVERPLIAEISLLLQDADSNVVLGDT